MVQITKKSFAGLLLLVLIIINSSYAQSWQELLKDENANFFEIKTAFEQEWVGKAYIKGKGYKQYKRWEYFMKDRILPDGTFPKGKQLGDFKAILDKPIDYSTKRGTNTGDWTPLGPFSNINTDSWSVGTGRVNFIKEDPNNSSIVYTGTPSGGLWKSIDGGSSWAPISDQLSSIGISSIAIDYNNSDIIYIATGDRDAGDTYSIGVMKSIDGGTTWNTTGTIPGYTNDILIDPNNSNIVWVAGTYGIYKSNNAGSSWTKMYSGPFDDIEFKPGDSQTVYGATSNSFYKTTDGVTFTKITNGLPTSGGRLAIGVTEANSSYVYLLSAKTDNTFQGVYRSTDSGDSFTAVNTTIDIFDGSDQAWYDMAIGVSNSNENIVFCGVLNIWKSTNGGTSWSQLNSWSNPSASNYTHADIHCLKYYNNNLYAGTDGGIYKSTDNGINFTDLSPGLQIGQFYRIGGSQNDLSVIAGGLQDNGGYFYTGGNWKVYYGADGMEAGVKPNNSNYVFGMIQYGELYESSNGGNSNNYIGAPSGEQGEWVTPMQMDPNGNRLLAGYSQLYEYNFSSGWNVLTNYSFPTQLTNIEIYDSNTDIIYLATDKYVYKTIDNGASITDVTGDLPLFSAGQNITSIEVNPLNSDEIWISVSGWNATRHVYYSTSGGNTWTNLSSGLPNLPCNIVKYDAGTNGGIYVGTDVGVYYWDNDIAVWEPYMTNLPNVIVRDLEINEDAQIIRAGTYGRGVWETPSKTFNNYCQPVMASGTANGDFIDGIALSDLSNLNTGTTGGNDYTYYNSMSASLKIDQPYSISITSGTNTNDYYAAWIDYNKDGDFDDVSEKLGEFQSTISGETKTINFIVPNTVSLGSTRLRIRCLNSSNIDPCLDGDKGETEDYKVLISELEYCIPSSTNGTSDGDFINTVIVGTISNQNTGGQNGPGYNDYTNLSTDLNTNNNYVVYIENGNYDGNVGAWIDYNQDRDFDDADEHLGEIYISSANSNGVINFTVPIQALEGNTRLRVRLLYNNQSPGVDACAFGDYGETEDYTVNIITQCSSISITDNTNNPTCGNSNGNIELIVTGGTSPYSYNWATGETTNTINNLVSGNYNYTVSDDIGCIKSASISLTDPGNPTITLSVSDDLCGLNNGSISTSITGGSSISSYTWSTGANTSSINNLTGGIYSLTVSDINNCLAFAVTTIQDNGNVSISLNSIQPTCLKNDGNITSLINGGTAPYVYLWNTGQTSDNISGLDQGAYIVTVQDINSCSSVSSINLSISNPILYDLTITPNTCGLNDGNINLLATGGNGSFSYLWNNNETTGFINGLNDGDYYTTITDAGNCFVTISSSLVSEGNISVSVNVTPTLCGENNAAISVNVIGGVSPYSYTWNNSATTANSNNLADGNYSITVSDINNCNLVVNEIIQPSTNPSIMLNITQPSCDESNGSISPSISGGTTPYNYTWSSNQTTLAISGLDNGIYTISLTDINNCYTSSSITLTNSGTPAVIVENSVDAICSYSNNGQTSLSVSGGATPYSYMWTNGTTTSSPTNLTAALHSYTVTDAMNCDIMGSVSISHQPEMLYSVSFTDVSCFNNGTISVTISSGISPYSYTWNNNATTSEITNLSSGNYYITITDGNNCIKTDAVTLNSLNEITISNTIEQPTCFNAQDGSILIVVSGGVKPYNYSWNILGETTDFVTGIPAGNYTATVTDNNNCSLEENITLLQPNQIGLSISTVDVLCSRPEGSAEVTISGGLSPYSYLWSNGNTSAQITGVEKGSYSVTVNDFNNCTVTTNTKINTTGDANITSFSENVSCNGKTTGSAIALASGASNPYSYKWNTGNTSYDLNNLGAGNYSVTITDKYSCEYYRTFTITEPPVITVSNYTITDATNQNCNGTIDIMVTGGVSPYSYLWSDNLQHTTTLVSGLCAGNYNVKINDSNNCFVWEFFDVQKNVGIDEQSLAKINIHPNPNAGIFYIYFNDHLNNVELELINYSGQQIYHFKSDEVVQQQKLNIDMSKQASGIYLLNLRSDDLYESYKIIVNNY